MVLNESTYFSEKSSREYISVSQFKNFQKCEAAAMAELNTAFQAASAEMYSQAGAQPGPDAGFNAGGADQNASQKPGKENIQDADFEEVK